MSRNLRFRWFFYSFVAGVLLTYVYNTFIFKLPAYNVTREQLFARWISPVIGRKLAAIEDIWTSDADDEKLTCNVPILNAFDPSIINIIDQYQPLKCRKVQDDLVMIDEENNLRFNDPVLRSLNMTAEDLECHYMTVERAKGDEDFQVEFGASTRLKETVLLRHDVVQVQCVLNPHRELIYQNLLTYPVRKPRKEYLALNETVLNVILIFMDSMSLSAMRRHMPKTLDFVEKVMQFNIFEGYNKVADNTFPNVIPMLTGKRAFNQQPDMMDEFHEDINRIYFDEWPMIWKNFSKKGYVTAFNEDHPEIGLFHIKGYGFREKPVDHFYLNYWSGMKWMTFPKQHTDRCYGNRAEAELMLDVLRNQLRRYSDTAQFLYNFLTYPSHTDTAMQAMLDDHFLQFFTEMHNSSAFNRSAVFFLADHGPRGSVLQATTVGLLEERMPFVSLYFPPWFYRKYPRILRNLRQNRHRLSSNFDVYETLQDLLHENFDGQQRPSTQRSLSLLYKLPAGRTCKQAGVPYFFCTCQELDWRNVSTNSAVFKYAGADFVNELNEVAQKNGKCARWNLKRILTVDALVLRPDQPDVTVQVVQADNFSPDVELYRVTVTAESGWVNGTFQALMLFNKETSQFNLHSEISRLDRYGHQSDCIKSSGAADLRKVCVCKDFVGNGTDTAG